MATVGVKGLIVISMQHGSITSSMHIDFMQNEVALKEVE